MPINPEHIFSLINVWVERTEGLYPSVLYLGLESYRELTDHPDARPYLLSRTARERPVFSGLRVYLVDAQFHCELGGLIDGSDR